jgi:mortality factor 4-like protein 1
VSLPREPTVAQLLEDYKASKSSKKQKDRYLILRHHKIPILASSRADEQLAEVIAGLKLYFDKALGKILLYRFERQQYAEFRKRHPNTPASEFYGAEHLLRLFGTFFPDFDLFIRTVQLPMLIAHTAMDQESVLVLREHLNQIVTYLQKNAPKLFLKDSEYENAPPEATAHMK